MRSHFASLDEISAMLIDSELFSHLPTAEIFTAARYFGIAKVARDEIVFSEGDAGIHLCIVHAGCIAVIKANQDEKLVEMFRVPRGRAFGEMAILDGERRSATCKATEDSTLLTLAKSSLDKMLEDHPRIGARILRAIAVGLSRRLRLAVGRLVDHVV